MNDNTKKRLYLILIVLSVAAIAGVLAFSAVQKEPEAPAAAAPTVPPTPTPQVIYEEVEKKVEKVITAAIIEDGLRDMGVLLTQEYYFTEVISFSSVKHLLKTDIALPFTESSFLAGYDGTVTAGIDFSSVTVEKDEETMTVTVYLPPSELQAVIIDHDSFRLYSEKNGVSNPLSAEDFNNSLRELEQNARTKAVEKGLLENSDRQAKAVVTNFVRSLLGNEWALNVVSGEGTEHE